VTVRRNVSFSVPSSHPMSLEGARGLHEIAVPERIARRDLLSPDRAVPHSIIEPRAKRFFQRTR